MIIRKNGLIRCAPMNERLLAGMAIDKQTGCWNWCVKIDRYGYGKITTKRLERLVHRVSYETWIGELPANKCVLHVCDNRKCINPKHLKIGTHQDNMADMYRKGRENLIGLRRGRNRAAIDAIAGKEAK